MFQLCGPYQAIKILIEIFVKRYAVFLAVQYNCQIPNHRSSVWRIATTRSKKSCPRYWVRPLLRTAVHHPWRCLLDPHYLLYLSIHFSIDGPKDGKLELLSSWWFMMHFVVYHHPMWTQQGVKLWNIKKGVKDIVRLFEAVVLVHPWSPRKISWSVHGCACSYSPLQALNIISKPPLFITLTLLCIC